MVGWLAANGLYTLNDGNICTLYVCVLFAGSPFRSNDEKEGEVQSIWVDQGANYTLPCGGLHVKGGESVMWIHEGKDRPNHRKQEDGSIFFPSVQKSDSGIYTCKMELSDSSRTRTSHSNNNNNYQESSRRKNYPNRDQEDHEEEEDSNFEVRVRIRVRSK
jgi:hypothetical protein